MRVRGDPVRAKVNAVRVVVRTAARVEVPAPAVPEVVPVPVPDPGFVVPVPGRVVLVPGVVDGGVVDGGVVEGGVVDGGVVDDVVVDDGVVEVWQSALVMVSLSRVTAPVWARALPCRVAPCCTLIDSGVALQE